MSKTIKAEDIYIQHGTPVFLFNLKGKSASGKEKEYNGYVTISEKYARENTDSEGNVTGSYTFKDVPEGKYTCTEYENMRYECSKITDVVKGTVEGDKVLFELDSDEPGKATFFNTKVDWRDYSDSSICVNKVGME